MQMLGVKIRHFRSIQKLDFEPTKSTVICGPNSCGKSNVLRALKFAFLPAYSSDRMAANFCQLVGGPNASITIEIAFDKPTDAIAAALGIAANQPFTYKLSVKRNGKSTCHINALPVDGSARSALLEGVLVVHVPPIRDLTAGGLDPFRTTLADALRKSRGGESFAGLTTRVREAIKKSGRAILAGTQSTTKNLLGVEELSVDVDAVEVDALLRTAGINFKVNNKEASLDKLGTGHQSSVILSLYRQVGIAAGKFVLYLFEEPDNHLHPTSLFAIAEDLKKCLSDDGQALITTHSPYFLNQFKVTDWLPLRSEADRTTALRERNLKRTDRELRLALNKYGLRPPEALLSRKVVVVEGVTDVTLLRTLVELFKKKSVDAQDVLVIPAGGKDSVVDLCRLLDELGASWLGVLDWDATEDTSQPMFKAPLSATDKTAIQGAIAVIDQHLRVQGQKQSKAKKSIDSMSGEIAQSGNVQPLSFSNSVLGKHLAVAGALNAAELTSLRAAVKSKRHAAARGILKKASLWIWSGAPEEVLMPDAAAENTVEAVLVQHQVLSGPATAPNRRATLLKSLHGLGHKAEVLEAAISALHTNQQLRARELKEMVARVVA